jgi:radical SAM superfamily enzyme YgiQ (UPF0313 family)
VDIVYIHPAKQEVEARYDQFKACSPYPFIPVGVIGLVNLLRGRGWAVEGLNLPVELLLKPAFDFKGWLASRSPAGLVMIDLHWYEHSYGAIEVARSVKTAWPKTPVLIGGLTATHFSFEIIKEFSEIDYIICGDAEKPLQLLVEYLDGNSSIKLADIPNLVYREEGRARWNMISYTATAADLDPLDYVTTNWLHHWESYAALQCSGAGIVVLDRPQIKGHWLTIGRGCTFNCAYCGGGKKSHEELAGRDGYVYRSPERVVEDIRRLKERGIDQVALSLDPATFKPAWWQSFFQLIQTQGIRIGLYNEFFQLPSPKFIEALAETADLRYTEVAISPLSGDEKVRQRNGKFYSNERLLEMLRTLKKFQIPIFIYFSLNLPGETPQTFKNTLRLANQISQTYPPELLRMLNPCHTLDPVSPMLRKPESFDILVKYRTFKDYYTYCKGTGWQPRFVTRGEHRGFEMIGRPSQMIEQMAQQWDAFATKQPGRCYPVPRGW